MLTKEEFTKTHPELRLDMKVYTRNGEKLGEIEDLNDQGLVVGKGWLLPKFSTIPYDDILEIRGNRVIISRKSSEMEGWRREESAEREGYERSGEERAGTETKEARTSVHEEELQAEKRE